MLKTLKIGKLIKKGKKPLKLPFIAALRLSKIKKGGRLKLLLFHNFRPMQIMNMPFKRP